MNRIQLLAVAIAIMASARVGAQGSVEKPSLSAGDRWTYKVTDVQKGAETSTFEARVTVVAGDTVELQRTTLTAADSKGVGQAVTDKVDLATWTPANPRMVDGKFVTIAFPIEVGKTWEYEYKTRAPNGFETSHQRKAKVEGWEEVRVPAGNFKVLRIVHDGRWTRTETNRTYSGVVTDTLWYSPEVRRFVKREYQDRTSGGRTWDHSMFELVSFELKK